MTEPAHVSLFAEMDAAADAMPAPNRDDLQLKLRRIVRARRPDLSRETWLELFEIWFERHLGSIRNRHAEAHDASPRSSRRRRGRFRQATRSCVRAAR